MFIEHPHQATARQGEGRQPSKEHKLRYMHLIFARLFDSLHPSQQFFSHVGTGLPGFNQY